MDCDFSGVNSRQTFQLPERMVIDNESNIEKPKSILINYSIFTFFDNS